MSGIDNPIDISQRLSLSSLRVSCCRKIGSGEEIEGGVCTGFLWQIEDELYLVTNWHNLTGLNPVTRKAIDKNGFTPTSVKLPFAFQEKVSETVIKRQVRLITVELYNKDGDPCWLEHPTHGTKVDIAAIKIGSIGDSKILSQPINSYDGFTNFAESVGDDAFVLGFPLGLDGGRRLPIWKRASIASEPYLDFDGLPKLLIDTATRKGMSGSPVIAVRRGYTMPIGGEESDAIFGLTEKFLGIYSGRIDDDPLGAQIGIVWKASAVRDVVETGKKGVDPFEGT